jgi:Cof subfamily protein (haloacid dehalogenase superfamily)
MSVRLVISDVDGTLVRTDKSLSDGVVAAVKRLQDADVLVSLISARPPSGVQWIAEKLDLTGEIGAFNGGTILEPDGTLVSAARVPPGVAKRTLAMFDDPRIITWLFSDGRWHTARLDKDHTASERVSANQEPIVRGDFSKLLDTVDKIVAVSDDHAMLAELEGKVAKELGDGATVIRSQVYYLDVTAATANKGDGIAALAKAAGVDLADVVVIGDQRNDMAMFARAGFSIAMAQGPEEVRRAATCTTGSNDEDGVAQAIDRIILPMLQGK